MIKIKQLFGMIFFICVYEIISIHPMQYYIFGIFELNSLVFAEIFSIYNPNNLTFYLAPILLVTYVISLIRIFKENTSSFWKYFAYIAISIFLVVEMFSFLVKYNPHNVSILNLDWTTIIGERFTLIGDTEGGGSVPSFIIFIFIIEMASKLSIIFIIFLIILIMFIPIISYITLKKHIKDTNKISEEIKDQTKISKKFFFIKPMNLIFMKQRLKFFKEFDKKLIYRKDQSYFRKNIKKIIIYSACGFILLIVWIFLNIFLEPIGTQFFGFNGFSGDAVIEFKYFSIWLILPFRIIMSLSFGYGLYLLIKIKKKFFGFINIEFEKNLIRNQNPNGIGISDDNEKFDKEDK